VVGFEVDPRCLLAAVDRGDAASIAGWFELGRLADWRAGVSGAGGTAKWSRSQSRAERWFCEPVKSIENRTDGEWCELRVEEDQWA
jgi:hypothetical protein